MRHVRFAAALAFCFAFASARAAQAIPITLDFEGMSDLSKIESFYDGGVGGDHGIQFGESALSLVQAGEGGTGNFSNAPSGKTIAFFPLGQGSMTMNVEQGFVNALAFFYTEIYYPGYVSIWSGANGTGDLLAIEALPKLSSDCGGQGAFNCWAPVSLAFQGIAQSVVWGGTGNFLGVDNVTIETPAVPEPASLLLLGSGLAVTALRRRARRSR